MIRTACVEIRNDKKLLVYLFVLLSSLVLINNAHAIETVSYVKEVHEGLVQPCDLYVSANGEMYVLDKKMSRISIFGADGTLKNVFGEKGSFDAQMFKPESMTVALNKEIMVTDTGNSRVLVFDSDGGFLYQLGNLGTRKGEFKSPSSIAVDILGNIYVGDRDNLTISKFSPNGAFLDVWSVESEPKDIVFDLRNYMYVLFPQEAKIKKYSSDGEFVGDVIDNESLSQYVSKSVSLSVDNKGDIYLIEVGENSIVKLNQDEEVLFEFGSKGVGRGQFDMPAAIFSDENGKVYVADSENERVQVFEIMGSEKRKIAKIEYLPPVLDYEKSFHSGRAIVDVHYSPEFGLYALSDDDGQILYNKEGINLERKIDDEGSLLKHPDAFYVLHDGKILVADTGNHQVAFLNADGSFDYRFGRKGKDRSEFNALAGISVDSQGKIFVSDTKNNRIQVFNSDGIYLDSFGAKTEISEEDLNVPVGTFLYPKDIVFDSLGYLYVLDTKNKRVQVFDNHNNFVREIGANSSKVDFKDPVDIAMDENDVLYVADRGDNAVKILNKQGELLMKFGSPGQGPSYFPNLTGVASFNHKIYVSDYDVPEIRVFEFENGLDPSVASSKKGLSAVEQVAKKMETDCVADFENSADMKCTIKRKE